MPRPTMELRTLLDIAHSVTQQIVQHLELQPPAYKALFTAPPPALSKRPV